jgi:ribonucleoside-diphosphate reductase alpha chain
MAGFNCSAVAIDHPRAFDELMYILMCGTGAGYSVERQFITKLPEVAETLHDTDTVIVVSDSKIGWSSALRELVSLLYSGKIPKWDVSKVRAKGEPLKTFGGRASGPEPLNHVFKFFVETFKKAAGRKLNSVECHDLCCKIAECIIVGGVRRSALISLSNLTDDRMRRAKSGQWWEEHPHRALANNSIAFTEKPDFDSFLNEWKALYDSKSGERGFFSRVAAQKKLKNSRREWDYDWLCNPCAEILLRSQEVCNLSEIVARSDDTLQSLSEKAEVASILGTLQSTLTDFRYVRNAWKKNCDEERLLGVSVTGIEDCPVLENDEALKHLRVTAGITNVTVAAILGINPSVAITTVKPSGTVSQLVDAASGIHPRFAPYYIRRVRSDSTDPLAHLMQAQGVPCEPCVLNPTTTVVFSFPQKAPEGAKCVKDRTAKEQLDLYMRWQDLYTEHKPSITVYYRDEEFLDLGQYVYNNFDKVIGISFLPRSDHTYQQAPYEEITKEQYEELVANMPKIDWSQLHLYEKYDTTTGTQELACIGNSCDISGNF